MARKPLSKRLRFEVFKRDGFRCVYCGATPIQKTLHVDHVDPVAKGGSNDPSNLVTACGDCNMGKSAVPLDSKALKSTIATEADKDHAEQIREYLAIQREVAKAKSEVVKTVADYWTERIGTPPEESMMPRFATLVDEFGMAKIMEAIDIVSWKNIRSSYGPYEQRKQAQYFHGVLRRWREGEDR